MSTTNIYALGKEPGEIGETRNSWRGAMYVWNDIASRYFGLKMFPISDRDPMRHAIWNADKTHPLPEHEKIVLLSTMDNATVKAADAEAVAAAFDKYGREHPHSSLCEQAEILRAAKLDPEDAIAWQQTSVGEFWGHNWNDERDDYDWYDPATGTKHFDVLEAARAAA